VELVTPEIAGVATYHLRLRGGSAAAGYVCQPGQFNMLYVPGVGETAISVSGYDAERDLWLHTIRTAGGVTGMLERQGVGASILVRGPFGTAWPIAQCAGHDVVIVAGGIGLAPLRPAIERLLDPTVGARRVTLIYGARTAGSRLYTRQFADWEARGLHIECIVDRATPDWPGHIGVATLLVDRLEPWMPQNTVLLTCGPEVMMRYVVRSARARGLQPPQIWLSLERNMQCAARLCGHCQLGPAFVCQDGPVFRLDRITPYLDVEQL
jgi:NAD(P)H-flavin reductase